jgi:DNA-binding response OmpR family regulator
MRGELQPGAQSLPGAAHLAGWAPTVLICARDPLLDELYGTLLWNPQVERYLASSLASGLMVAVAARPHLIILDRDLPEAERLITYVRSTPQLFGTAVAVISRDYFPTAEAGLLGAGADAIFRLPATPEWNVRLARLLLANTRLGP